MLKVHLQQVRKEREEETMLKKPSYSWWFDRHISPKRSYWLQSTISELEEKIQAMLTLIEEDADSFAQRAEMYYNKRPELVKFVEDFYRTHRSLAEKYDQLKSEAGTKFLTTQLGSPRLSKKYSSGDLLSLDKWSVASFDTFDSGESEVDDPDQEENQACDDMGKEVSSKDSESTVMKLWEEIVSLQEEIKIREAEELMQKNKEKAEAMHKSCFPVTKEISNENEVLKLREEIKKLKEENRVQMAEIMRSKESKREAARQLSLEEELNKERSREVSKLREEIEKLSKVNRNQTAELKVRNEEKREAIRQLCTTLEILKEDNNNLRKCLKDSRKKSPLEWSKWKAVFSSKFFNSKFQPSVVAL